MKIFILFLLIFTSLNFTGPMCFAGMPVKPVLTDRLTTGCGWSDEVYAVIAKTLPQKSVSHFSLKSKGAESARQLYFFSDRSWFLTLEFLSTGSASEDISCIVDHGAGQTSEDALNYNKSELPAWKWGLAPPHWP